MAKNSSRQNSLKNDGMIYKKYIYTPLDSSHNSIRLLRLRSASDESWPIRCTIFHARLDDLPPYVALSYTWGDSSGSSPIFVDSETETVSVTRNLLHALRRLRPTTGDEDLVMWIDAICINQDDIPERNVQTANMRTIYQRASSVAVWLGLENYGSSTAIQLSRDMNACHSRDEIIGLIVGPDGKEHLKFLVALFRRQYWWRIWVIQEVSCAKRAVVYCGGEKIEWSLLDNTCSILKTVEDQLRSIFYQRPSYTRTLTFGGPRGLHLSRYSPNTTAPPLLDLLVSHKSKKSTDPKDKVYALVGISSSRHTFGPIDYSLSPREIYSHTARHIITTSQKLDVICVKQHDINQFSLPSWVPDWTRLSTASGAVVIGLHHHEPPFTAAGETLANILFSPDGYVLTAKGTLIDRILTLGMPYKQRGPPGDVLPALEVFHDWWNIFVASFSNSLSAQTRFARAISAGSWKFSTDDEYVEKLEAIFSLSDQLLSGSDMLGLDPPRRSSTMGSSTGSLLEQDEEDIVGVYEEEEKTRMSAMLEASLMMNRRRLFLSEDGRVGLAPWNAAEDDLVCLLLGCRFPVVLRREEGHYVLIGEVFVEGFMQGEAVEGLQRGAFELQSFEIH